jgi:hypothetical protein
MKDFFLHHDEEVLGERIALLLQSVRASFFPAAPDIEDRVMAAIYAEEAAQNEYAARNEYAVPLTLVDQITGEVVSLRSWVITGIIVLVSLTSAFFGIDFIKVAAANGSAFLLPVGLTVGGITTFYGALFIASHLEELSERFGLRR